ncbi:MAG: tyrosine--tRNA ligase [Patescibacteria group bacterium]|nr:tyrosine--tRNA ligase [Patescibacteria group bacterium]MDE2057536.1 tyrosine--tRNA ligase [Patescibacteria group bacterium]
MTLAEELAARGLIEQSSAPAEKILGGERTVYWGIDPSADSAHAGNLVSVLLMKRLGRAGHKLVFLVGGGTGMIGDPKEAGERPLLDVETIEKNVRTLEKQLRTILGSEQKFEMVNNADWLLKEKLVDFLRDIGKHFTVNELVKRDVIRRRLETPDESISYTEFAYSLLQGYDYYVLHQERGVDLQIGGSDQWTNILSGVELIRRKAGQETFALTVPIVTDAVGKKFGKSEGNAVWLDPKKTSPFAFYQFWLRLPDDGLEKYLKMYTFLSLGEIEALMLRHRAAPQEREAQEVLASQVTELVHGPAAAAQAAAATDALYGDTPFEELSAEARAVALAEAPSLMLGKSELEAGYSLAEALVAGGLASSKSDARRLIEGKGITLSGLPITDPDQKLYPGDLSGGHALIRKGKRDVLILKLK